MGGPMNTVRLCALGLVLVSDAAHATDICEPLREQIEVQIAGTGATGFAVVVVDADAEVAGKVVGTCAKGARKLVYVRAAGSAAPAKPARPATAAPRPRASDANVITECRDGTVVRGNAPCKP